MNDAMTPARERLQAAQTAHAEAAKKADQLRTQRQKLHDVALRKGEIEAELAAARDQHKQALAEWAQSGASTEAPELPSSIERLERKLVAVQREADAANDAADSMNAAIDVAQRDADATLAELRHRREDVLREVAAPLIDKAHQAALQLNSMREHLAAFGVIANELRDESPRATHLDFEIGEAVRVFPVLEPGGAEASRNAWRSLIANLAGDATAQLAPPPRSVDSDIHVRKPFLPAHLREV